MYKVRYSTISTAHKCMKYYELKHVQGLDDESGLSGDMAFGTAIHLAVQDLFEEGNGVDVFTAAWKACDKPSMKYTRLKWADLNLLGQQLLKVFKDEHLADFNPIALEQKLEHPLTQDILLGGTADFVGKHKGTLSMVDWKTAAMPYDSYKIMFNEQLYGYSWLVKEALKLDVEQIMYVVFVKDPANPRIQLKKALLTKKKLSKVMHNITLKAKELAITKEFVKNPNACVIGRNVCPFFNKCHG